MRNEGRRRCHLLPRLPKQSRPSWRPHHQPRNRLEVLGCGGLASPSHLNRMSRSLRLPRRLRNQGHAETSSSTLLTVRRVSGIRVRVDLHTSTRICGTMFTPRKTSSSAFSSMRPNLPPIKPRLLDGETHRLLKRPRAALLAAAMLPLPRRPGCLISRVTIAPSSSSVARPIAGLVV